MLKVTALNRQIKFILPDNYYESLSKVRVTIGQLNGYIGKAKNGDKHYAQFKNKEDQLMSAGLIGPVVIR